jgi:hypothetical protein
VIWAVAKIAVVGEDGSYVPIELHRIFLCYQNWGHQQGNKEGGNLEYYPVCLGFFGMIHGNTS